MSARKTASKVTIVDYRCGNIFNLKNALESCGAEVIFAADPDCLGNASHLVLPGVGAFGQGARNLKEQSLYESIVAFARSGKPLLGVCLGMQLLLTQSHEHGVWDGLNLIPGEVVSLRTLSASVKKVPQIGWNGVVFNEAISEQGRFARSVIMQDWASGTCAYFVHSMAAKVDAKYVIGVSEYAGARFASVIARDNVVGMQFHPERSGPVGLQLLRRFVEA